MSLWATASQLDTNLIYLSLFWGSQPPSGENLLFYIMYMCDCCGCARRAALATISAFARVCVCEWAYVTAMVYVFWMARTKNAWAFVWASVGFRMYCVCVASIAIEHSDKAACTGYSIDAIYLAKIPWLNDMFLVVRCIPYLLLRADLENSCTTWKLRKITTGWITWIFYFPDIFRIFRFVIIWSISISKARKPLKDFIGLQVFSSSLRHFRTEL